MKQNRVVCLPGHALLVFIFRSYRDFQETGPRALKIKTSVLDRERDQRKRKNLQFSSAGHLVKSMRRKPCNHSRAGNYVFTYM